MPFSDLFSLFGINCIGAEFISGNLQLPLYETLPSQIELQIRKRQKAELQIPLNSLGIRMPLVLVRSETSESVLLGQAKSTSQEKKA